MQCDVERSALMVATVTLRALSKALSAVMSAHRQ
jgi:hypothetical protein